MKLFAKLLLVVSAVGLTFSGCSGGAEEPDPVDVDVDIDSGFDDTENAGDSSDDERANEEGDQ